jgi:CHAT domain-containing protein/Tfp pilus assembly protein PilF
VEDGPDAIARNAFGDAVSILAEVLYAKGNLDRSMAQFERAGRILHDDRKGRARTHLFSGYIAGSLGSPDKAVSEISRALELSREIRNKSGEGLALTALGLFNSFLKNDDKAIQLHRTAIDIFRSIGDRSSEGIALNALGQSYESRKEYTVALEHYQQALRLFQDQGVLDFASVTLFKVAKAFQLMGKFDQALDYHERCLQASRAAGKQRTEVNALIEMASLFAAQNRPEQALRQYQKIRKFYEGIGDRRGQAIALNTHGDFLFDVGKKQQALDSYNRSLPLSEEVGDKDILIATLYGLARAHRDLGSYDVALSYIKRSIEIIEDLRTNVGSPDVRASYFSGVRKHYELNINILMQLDRVRPGGSFAADALLLSEKSRARLLIDLLRESAVNFREGASKDLLERERILRGLLQSLARYQYDLSLRVRDATEIADVASRMAQLRAEYQEIQSQLRQQHPRLLALERTTPPALTQIQNELRDNTVVLEFALGDEQSYLWAITSNSLHSYELPSRKVLEEAVKEVYALITARQGSDGATDRDYQEKLETADPLYLEKASSLSQILLGPVAEQLGTKRLVVVAEGALQYLAFDALPAPRAPSQSLIDMHEIVVLPSISTLIAIRNSPQSPSSAGKVVAVFADPVFSRSDDRVQTKGSEAIAQGQPEEATSKASEGVLRGGGLARLIHAAEEADAISAAAPRGTVMVAKGFEASRDAALSLPVSQYKILHFATHAFVDNEHPELSGIALAMLDSNGVEKNGLVPLHDIYSLDLSADLTVLSACQTALGKDIKGEGLVGLTHSFMSAGSKSVVASLWKVDDRATSILMRAFYRSMLEEGMTPAAALRSAKLKMMKDARWSAPYYWAGFVLQGEYTNHISIESNSWFGFGVVSSLLLIVILSGVIIFQRRWRRAWGKVV